MVRTLSPRMPEPACSLRTFDRASCFLSFSISNILARRREKALSLFCFWLLLSSALTDIPVGICLRMTAVSVLLRCCPPGPEPLVNCSSRSQWLMVTWASVGSGKQTTVTVDVWTRPRFSVGETLCQRWPPASAANLSAPLPEILRIAMLGVL